MKISQLSSLFKKQHIIPIILYIAFFLVLIAMGSYVPTPKITFDYPTKKVMAVNKEKIDIYGTFHKDFFFYPLHYRITTNQGDVKLIDNDNFVKTIEIKNNEENVVFTAITENIFRNSNKVNYDFYFAKSPIVFTVIEPKNNITVQQSSIAFKIQTETGAIVTINNVYAKESGSAGTGTFTLDALLAVGNNSFSILVSKPGYITKEDKITITRTRTTEEQIAYEKEEMEKKRIEEEKARQEELVRTTLGVSRKTIQNELSAYRFNKGEPVDGEENYFSQEDNFIIQLLGHKDNLKAIRLIRTSYYGDDSSNLFFIAALTTIVKLVDPSFGGDEIAKFTDITQRAKVDGSAYFTLRNRKYEMSYIFLESGVTTVFLTITPYSLF